MESVLSEGEVSRAQVVNWVSAATSIERLPFDLSVLEAGGVFINVDAANFGLLDRRLDWQALGITLPRGSDLAFRAPALRPGDGPIPPASAPSTSTRAHGTPPL